MLSPVPAPSSTPSGVRPADWLGPSTSGRSGRRPPNDSASRSGSHCPVAGEKYPVPEASPRSVCLACWPPSRQVSQSCGSSTLATRSALAGSCSASQASLVTVKLATGTSPVRVAQASAPSRATSVLACGADRVSFHSSAGRTTAPAWSRVTMPCCCPATAIASTGPGAAARAWPIASWQADHHTSGCTSVPSGWPALPSATTCPVSASTTSALVDWVDESIPITSVTARIMPGSAGHVQGVDRVRRNTPSGPRAPRRAGRSAPGSRIRGCPTGRPPIPVRPVARGRGPPTSCPARSRRG